MKRILLVCCAAVCLCACEADGDQAARNLSGSSGNAVIRNGATNHYKRESPYVNDDQVIRIPFGFIDKFSSSENNVPAGQRARKIAEAVAQLDGVGKASVSVLGGAAIVGLETDGVFDDNKLVRLKNDVETRVRVSDKSIRQVAVGVSKPYK